MGKNYYALESGQGLIEVTKGTYLSAIRRKQAQLKTRAKGKLIPAEFTDPDPCCSIKTVRIAKRPKARASTVKKTHMLHRKVATPMMNCRLRSGKCWDSRQTAPKMSYPVYQDSELFPPNISMFNISLQCDNDCESDSEQVSMAVNSLILSLSVAVYDSTRPQLC